MTTARLLLVEDDPDNLEVLTVILSDHYHVLSCSSADAALAALETGKPDLLLLDICMGPVDGLACLKAIRATPGYGSIPAIALTGYAHDVERRAFQAAGFQRVIIKPILDYEELFAAITALLTSPAAPSYGASPGEPSDDQTAVSPRALGKACLDSTYRMTA
jgi:CheY-like chemotaxis protein